MSERVLYGEEGGGDSQKSASPSQVQLPFCLHHNCQSLASATLFEYSSTLDYISSTNFNFPFHHRIRLTRRSATVPPTPSQITLHSESFCFSPSIPLSHLTRLARHVASICPRQSKHFHHSYHLSYPTGLSTFKSTCPVPFISGCRKLVTPLTSTNFAGRRSQHLDSRAYIFRCPCTLLLSGSSPSSQPGRLSRP